MPTENEMKTNAFKVRLDVLEELKGLLAQVSVSIRGKDLAKNVYKTQLLSSVSIVITITFENIFINC